MSVTPAASSAEATTARAEAASDARWRRSSGVESSPDAKRDGSRLDSSIDAWYNISGRTSLTSVGVSSAVWLSAEAFGASEVSRTKVLVSIAYCALLSPLNENQDIKINISSTYFCSATSHLRFSLSIHCLPDN